LRDEWKVRKMISGGRVEGGKIMVNGGNNEWREKGVRANE